MGIKFQVLFVLFSLSLATIASADQQCVSQATPQQVLKPASSSYKVDYAGTKPDAQTVRVVSDDMLWSLVAPLEKKYNTTCKIVLSETVNVENPHWVCLNNQTCSYSVVVKCYDNVNPKKQVLKIEVLGLDDTKQALVQSFTVYYQPN